MQSNEIRSRFLKFFEERGHKIVPSSSLLPENDPSVLFTTAGMQQFKPYYTAPQNAQKDFDSKNTTSSQKCVRTSDIDEVGDKTHLSFFEMLGNFSFGGYGKKEAITFAYDFITKELGLTISYVTYYEGAGFIPADEKSKKIWEEIGVKDVRKDGSDVFWGPTGDSGPCGPTTEIYCKNASGEDVEIWNIVFNEYFCDGSREKFDKGEANLTKLETFGVDTGMGFERLLMTENKKDSIYETDLFEQVMSLIKEKAKNYNEKSARVVADHLRSALFMVSDNSIPGNKGSGYITRRLIRRAVVKASGLGLSDDVFGGILDKFVEKYKDIYPKVNNDIVRQEIKKEISKFKESLEQGIKEFNKDTDPFILATTYGFPIELTEELANEKGLKINREDFDKKMVEHQKLSKTASVGMFKGGLLNDNEKTIKLHTAHHLLLAGLQATINQNIKQKGSNINEERLRIDFLCDHKLTDEEKKKIEDWVNDKIKAKLNVVHKEMSLVDAQKIGAQMEFGAKYKDNVSVYFIEDDKGNQISKEFCAGPHVKNTSELASVFDPDGNPKGNFKIIKEEAVASGVRRIKAVLL
ncbi:MAG: alanine--tRNA ligase-related protein [bacterium]